MREKSSQFEGKIRLAHCSLLGIPMKMTNISSYSLLRWRHRRLQMPHLQSHRPSCSHSPLATCTIGFWSTCMRKAEANKLLLSANMSLFVQVEASAFCKHVSICSSWTNRDMAGVRGSQAPYGHTDKVEGIKTRSGWGADLYWFCDLCTKFTKFSCQNLIKIILNELYHEKWGIKNSRQLCKYCR